MTIYDIDEAIRNCIDMETGEIVNIEELHNLQMYRDTKIDNIACWYKEICAEVIAIKQEKENLDERQKSKDKQSEQLKAYLSKSLQGQKFESARNKIGWRKSIVVDIFDEAAVGEDYTVIEEVRKIDKIAIKEAIQKGVIVNGAVLLEKNNIQVK